MCLCLACSPDRVEVAYHGQRWVYKVLATLEFNSDRKRMTVVCR
jgi:magnesium-transporting ATPase (P-type)